MLNIWASQQEGNPTPPFELISDSVFKLDGRSYTLNGVPKTYDDLWVNQAEMLTDAGMQFDFAWESGPTTSASTQATGSADLFDAVIGAEINCTAVIDVTIATPSTAYGLNLDLWLLGSLFAGFSYDKGTPPPPLFKAFDTNVLGAFEAYPNAIPTAGFNRMAFTIKPDRIITSCNGYPAATRMVTVPYPTKLRLWFYAVSENSLPLNATIVCERARFFQAITDSNVLQSLSAL